MFNVKKTIMSISGVFGLANVVIHFMLFISSFDYPNILANICFYTLFVTWLGSIMISNYKEKDDLINFIQKTRPLAAIFVII